jgi:hypothetical protein
MSYLAITTNERALLEKIKDVSNFPSFTAKNLAVGDIAIFNETGHPKCIIERKTVSDLFLPLSGEIVEFNDDLESNPDTVNGDPYGKGWMVKVKFSDASEMENLLSSEDYKALIGA